jgi:hypothetical protein
MQEQQETAQDLDEATPDAATKPAAFEAFSTKMLEDKLEILDKVFAKHPRRSIRYFLVVGEWGEDKKTIIVHVHSGAWISLENSFDEAVERLDNKPESDAPLLSAILTTRSIAMETAIEESRQSEPEPEAEQEQACSLEE